MNALSSGNSSERGESSAAEVLVTYDLDLLAGSLRKWERSEALRTLYIDMYSQMMGALASGPTLEIGSGIGVMKKYMPGLTISDVVRTPYVDIAVSAYNLAGERGRFSNVVAMDVLHHLHEPWRFINEAAGILPKGGRVVLMEPAATWWGRFFYRCFHVEPCLPEECALEMKFPEAQGGFANMGIAWAMWVRDRESSVARLALSGMKLHRVQFRDVLAYPLTGGFSKPAMLPAILIKILMRLERQLPQSWLRRLGLRVMIVLERL